MLKLQNYLTSIKFNQMKSATLTKNPDHIQKKNFTVILIIKKHYL